jgi:hypothetical protein
MLREKTHETNVNYVYRVLINAHLFPHHCYFLSNAICSEVVHVNFHEMSLSDTI